MIIIRLDSVALSPARSDKQRRVRLGLEEYKREERRRKKEEPRTEDTSDVSAATGYFFLG